jgi:DNA-binding winged helix-turn-helix (wHTH) protein
MTDHSPRYRYRFDEFTVSPSTRLLLKGDVEIPLIPRYFDLLVLLIERRNEAVTRNEIFDRVWNDVIVSDGALTQAIRSLRRSLGDRAKEPRFIRTVSRHGYRFVFEDVVEEEVPANGDSLQAARARLVDAEAPTNEDEEERLREAAEVVLRSSPDEDLSQFNDVARALLRDARWDLPDADRAPLVGFPGPFAAIRILLGLRMRTAWRLVQKRWMGATLGGIGAGVLGGLLGALVLLYGPGSRATGSVLVALPIVGAGVGGLGAFGVGGGLAWAEALVRSYRRAALVVLGSAGGGFIGGLTHFVGLYTFEGLFGRDLSPVGGGFEGLVLGAAVGAGYALATPIESGGMATPRGRARWRVALTAGLVCAGASILLAWSGHHLGAMSLDFAAESFPGSQVSLDPLARLLGEPSPGLVTRCGISGFEGLFFGFGLVAGLTRRPRV